MRRWREKESVSCPHIISVQQSLVTKKSIPAASFVAFVPFF